jgi:hypothetical protein
MVSNPTFDVNTAGWSFAYRFGGAATVASVPMAGSATNVGKVTVTNIGTTTGIDNVQLSTRVFLVKDRNYLISFKANADAPRNITLRLLQDVTPFGTLYTVSNIGLTTTQSTYGTYAYTSTFTGYVALRFFVATNTIPVYFDDVIMIEEAPVVLPVSLLSFTGTLHAGKAVLNWKTASEINTQEFVLEKSSNAQSFTAVGTVPAKNGSTGAAYSFTDNDAVNGVVYYRLKSFDKDGLFSTSKIVVLKAGKETAAQISIFPNPVSAQCTVSYPRANSNGVLSVFTADGKKIAEYIAAAGSTQRSIDLSELKRGTYFIEYTGIGQKITSSFVK